ncbi:MAG: AAA family ATPase [Candidatus Omnitrophica bacterium]|nr:AAA family ATPase [Candidatus Omnitrophota bacterium]
MRVVAVANQKGGCGKTTTSINLAASLAHRGCSTLLIDLDPQAHASFGLGRDISSAKIEGSIYNVITDIPERRKSIEEVIIKVRDNLRLVPSHILLSTAEQELFDKIDAVSRLYLTLNTIAAQYDYVVIDCPPSLGFLTFNALRASHMVIIPVEVSFFSLVGVNKIINMLELIQLKIHHLPKIKGLVTIYDKRSNFTRRMLEDIKGYFKNNLSSVIIRINIALKEAADEGIPVLEHKSNSNGAVDYLALADEVIAESDRIGLEGLYGEIRKKEEQPSPAPPQPELESPEPEQVEDQIASAALAIAKILKLYAPNAANVHIVGDFNGWQVNDETRAMNVGGGWWEKKIDLSPGEYRYKFFVDGIWHHDPRGDEIEDEPSGERSSILKIS